MSFLKDWWLPTLPIFSPGFITALVVTALMGHFCFVKLTVKTGYVFFKSLSVAFFCLVCLLTLAIVGVLIVGTGLLGIPRGWASFGDAYIWGVLSLPILAFFVSLGCFFLSNPS